MALLLAGRLGSGGGGISSFEVNGADGRRAGQERSLPPRTTAVAAAAAAVV